MSLLVLLTWIDFSVACIQLSLFEVLRLFSVSSLVLFRGLCLIRDGHKLYDSPAIEIKLPFSTPLSLGGNYCLANSTEQREVTPHQGHTSLETLMFPVSVSQGLD